MLMQEESYMSFENYVDEMRSQMSQAQIDYQKKASAFTTFLKDKISEAIKRNAETTFNEMKECLARQIIANPQNQSYDHRLIHAYDALFLLSEYGIPSEYETVSTDHKILNELNIVRDRDTNDVYQYYVLLLRQENSVFHKTKHFNVFYTHLQSLAIKEGFHLSACIEGQSNPVITIRYQRTIPQPVTQPQTGSVPAKNDTNKNNNDSSKPNWVSRVGEFFLYAVGIFWVGTIIVGLLIFFFCR